MSTARDKILHRHAQELADFDAQERRNVESMAQWHAHRGPFIVRAALMFKVSCAEVTQAQYAAAVQQTERDTMPRSLR